MPWCPNCKAEYQEGITECSDCKVALVEDIKEAEVLEPFFQAEDKKIAEKLVKFFQYSDLNASYQYDEESELYVVSIPPKQVSQAKKLYQAFYFVERERYMKGESNLFDEIKDEDAMEDSGLRDSLDSDFPDNATESYDPALDKADLVADADTDDDEDLQKSVTPSDEVTAFDHENEHEPSVYVMKEDQYKDLSGTVGVFLIFGVAGIFFVILNIIGILNILSGWIPITVMSVLFLFFIYVAVTTHQKAKKVQAEIAAEKQLTEKINEWLKENVTENFLSSLHNEDISDELNYIKKTDTIKEMLLQEFGPQNPAYLDRLIEEFYTKTYGYE